MPILIVILYALFAATFSLGKLLLSYSPPIFLVGIRMVIAGSILLIYEFYKNRLQFALNKKHFWEYLKIIIFTTYLPYMFRFFGLQNIASSKACLLYNLSPFISYILSYLLFSEKVTIKKTVGLTIGFVGFLPSIFVIPMKNPSISAPSLLPESYIIISVIFMSYGWLLVHRLVKQYQYKATMINSISMTFGGILALITSFIFEGFDALTHITDFYSFLSILAIVIIISNLICHNLYVELLKKYSPTFLSFAAFLSPLFAALYGWIFLSETVTWNFCLTIITVLIGLTLFYHDEMKEVATPAIVTSEL